jgi:pantoate--beta-alanine ligase
MKVLTTIQQVRDFVQAARARQLSVGLVPTMGNLHEGHYSLIRAAAKECGCVVVSIFVNPTQFGPNEDYATYPRTPEQDLAGCQAGGAAAVFMPSVEEMYPRGQTLATVSIASLGDNLCGASRSGHFTGVCTVVSKLFNIVRCDKAFFGMKDFQQLTIIRRMVDDLNFPIEIVPCPTVREPDGLAMSSRNSKLSKEHRAQAPALHASLELAREMILEGVRDSRAIIEAIAAKIAAQAPGGAIDYVKVVHPDTLKDVQVPDGPVLVALAVRFQGARLIDNILVDAAAKAS